MTPAFEEIPDAIPSCPDNSGEGRVVPQSWVPHEGFLWRQLSAAGLAAVAERVAVGRDLDLEEALALSRASLPLLAVLITLRRDAVNSSPVANDNGDTEAPELPIERVAAFPKLWPRIGQCQADWELFCHALFTIRGTNRPTGVVPYWYLIVEQPLDHDRRVGFSPPVSEGGLKPALPSQEIASPCDGGFTGVEILRAIALARLVLPAEIEVRAPLATLGPKLAQVALDFGASHLGYVAPDGQTPDDPLVADPSVLEELVGSCLPTKLEEERK